MLAAYLLSLAFALAYARVMVAGRWSERLMLPLLDILQSVPILSFFRPPYWRRRPSFPKATSAPSWRPSF
jgi:hypothetical protein